MSSVPDPDWRSAVRARTSRPPPRARRPLWVGVDTIGSLEPALVHALLDAAPAARAWLRPLAQAGVEGWQVVGDVQDALHALALALRDAGLAGAWRDEQLAVTSETGQRIATIERAAVRPLGIATHAVHLVGCTPDGWHWVQRRALTKPNDPGLLDTLVGGMVPAHDDLHSALARETWEEAGLQVQALQALQHGGQVTIRQPSRDGRGMGYVVERIDWFRATLPAGLAPVNQDGEVDEFLLMSPGDLGEALARDAFTPEAALILCAAGL